MSPRSLEINVQTQPGGSVFARRFTRFASEISDLHDLFEDVAKELERTTEQNFASQGSRTGSRWAQLSEAYARWKATKHPGKPILVATGALKRSLSRGGAGHIRQVGRRTLVWGTADPKAHYHQAGTRVMPARPIIRINAQDQREWTRLVHLFLLERSRGLSHGGVP